MRYSRAITLGLVLAVMACKTSSMMPSAQAEDRQPGGLLIVTPAKSSCHIYRSAKTGQIVSRRFAMFHPSTTVRERCTTAPRH